MAIGVESVSVDLDSIFDLLNTVAGDTLAANTGIRYSNTDIELSTRYENIIYGTSPPLTGIKSVGINLSNIFCALGTTLVTSLPAFPNAFTTSPQPATGTSPMTLTITGGPGGTYTYVWSVVVGTGSSFTIVSGQGTDTIQWSATGTPAEPATDIITCIITSNLTGAVRKTHTSMRFNVP